jgi:transcriptional regulator with XRE-family HTH domain
LKQRHSRRHKALRAILKETRLKAGLRQIDLCKRLGRDKNYVSHIEVGDRMLDALEFIDYAEALGVQAAWLITKLKRRGPF